MRGVNRQAVVRLELNGRTHAGAEPVVDVLLHAQVGLDGVDVAGKTAEVADDAERCRVTCRNVETELGIAPETSAADEAAAQFGESLFGAELGLIRDVPNRPRQRSGPEERALRSAQHLDAADVEEIEVGREQREGNRRLIEVRRNLFLHARLIADDLPGGNAAHRDLALTGAEILHREPTHICRHPLEVFDTTFAQHLLGRGGDGERHIVQRLVALHRGNGDLLAQRRLQREVDRH